MNFYLSVVDDRLRHPDDKPSVGIILCKSRSQVIVQYSLRDTSKPMGVAAYQLTHSLPEEMKGSLPTIEELEGELGGIEQAEDEEEGY